MKKRGHLLFFILLLFFSFNFISSAENSSGSISVSDSTDEQSKVDKAYLCLNNKLKDKCDSMSDEERVFSLLSSGECKDELLDNSKNNGECWPESGCNLKTTAQAVFSLQKSNSPTDKAKKWLLSKKGTTSDLIWYLQIESASPTKCTIIYKDDTKSISIDENRKISSNAGSCLTVSEGNYWFIISQNCYGESFDISCDQSFSTNLLFKKKTSSTIYVLGKTSSASSEGTTTELVNSSCFIEGNSCNYEGSLWASVALSTLKEDISEYLPYLVSMADENQKIIPESFLFMLTGHDDFRNSLLLKKKSNNYWDESGDKFYDTATALLSLKYENLQEKSSAKDWLLSVQDKEGCWQGNIRNTAFILYSVWPKTISITEDLDCETSGYNCMSGISCKGEILDEYSCSGSFKCCNKEKEIGECTKQGGEICNSEQICSGGSEIESSDLEKDQTCCISGICKDNIQEPECESENKGTCRDECGASEEENSYGCNDYQKCCAEKTKKTNYTWIWILLILIILVSVGIFFKDKLRELWFRFKLGSSGKSTSQGISRGPPPGGFPLRQTPRRILPPQITNRVQTRPPQKPPKDLDDVLKRLKEIGK